MIGEIAEFLAAPVVSGVVGMIGGYLNKRQELKAIKEQNAHALAMEESRRQTATTLSKLKVEEVDVAGKWRNEEINAKSFGYSQKTKSKVSDVIRSFVRPIILACTGYLVYLNMKASQSVIEAAGGLPVEQVVILYTTQVVSMLSIFTMACGWYFGERTSKFTDKFLKVIS